MRAKFTDIVIPIHGALEFLRGCIASVSEHTRTGFRLILVDDFTEAHDMVGFLNDIRHSLPETIVVTTGKQKWFTRASNIGLRLARTERVVLLNSDTLCREGWLDELYSVWNSIESEGKKVGCVGSVHSPSSESRWSEPIEPNYVTMHAVLLSMKALSEVADRRGTPGWYFDETRQDAIHIRSDRYLSYDLNRLGYTTAISFHSHVAHIGGGGKSWGHNLGKVSDLRTEDLT